MGQFDRAAYQAEVKQFINESESSVLGKLTQNHCFRHLEEQQISAWIYQIKTLQEALAGFEDGYIFFEFEIPRIGKRADVVLLLSGNILVLEYKVGSDSYDSSSIDQVYDYALDLKNFHSASHLRSITPILVATRAAQIRLELSIGGDGVAKPLLVNSESLRKLFNEMPIQPPMSISECIAWANSEYRPTPTIIEAAQRLYEGHTVEEISRSDSGAINLTKTYGKVAEVIEYAKTNNKKVVCLVTGVPGAGKTLAGLNIATKRKRFVDDEHAVFLSGNSPLVAVLKEALARNKIESISHLPKAERIKKSVAYREASTFIQNIHHFRDEYLKTDNAPVEKVVIFDEAQRAWNQEKTSSFMKTKKRIQNFNMSEPEFLLSVMNRHDDWCVVVFLIGDGQEINTGEGGISEWFKALEKSYQDWDIFCSDKVVEANESANRGNLKIDIEPDLHLAVSLRSFRAENLSAFMGSVINGDLIGAKAYKNKLTDYPIYLTRSFEVAKRKLRSLARGNERIGLVASSNAIRLKPEGIYIKGGIDPPLWFLNGKSDIRSSFSLEDVATEFDIQGLELDWVGLCWDANYRFLDGKWCTANFSGTKWQAVHKLEQQSYIANSYRVLLTRGRQGLVIFIPLGDDSDETRPVKFYEGTCEFLKSCGIEEIF
jgi:hypothetical protein